MVYDRLETDVLVRKGHQSSVSGPEKITRRGSRCVGFTAKLNVQNETLRSTLLQDKPSVAIGRGRSHFG